MLEYPVSPIHGMRAGRDDRIGCVNRGGNIPHRVSTLRRWLGSPAGLLTAAAFLATRAWLLFLHTPHTTDTRIYFRWLTQAAAGRVPLVDFSIEYPPFAWWVIQVPAAAERLAYQFRFRALMSAADIASFALLAWIVSRRRPSLLTAFAFLYITAPLILWHELYDRLDMGVLLFVVLALAAWVAAFDAHAQGTGEEATAVGAPRSEVPNGGELPGKAQAGVWLFGAYAAVGLGTAYKLFPAVVVPFFVVSELFTRTRVRFVALRVALFAAVAMAPVALTYAQVGTHAFDFLRYHGLRGIEIGSTWASVMWLLSLAGYPADVVIRFGSWELAGAAEPAVLKAASLATFLVPSLLAAWALVLRGRFTGERAYAQAALAFAGVLVVAKVFSPQFLIWGFPVITLVAVEVCATKPRFLAVGVWVLVCSGLTTLVYQGGGSGEIGVMRPWVMHSLLARNAMYVSLWLVLLVALARRDWAARRRRSARRENRAFISPSSSPPASPG